MHRMKRGEGDETSMNMNIDGMGAKKDWTRNMNTSSEHLEENQEKMSH